ncbi:MAG TPA: molybdate ABC transporter substrate-binding protein [Ktedonobacteraceae bacterium]|nr:molybdate ABC transporter substrate-binding protein [Ktedonobacteraceae bacterium]
MKHILRVFLLSVVVCLLLAACGASSTSGGTPIAAPAPVTLNVFAAASLTESFNEIAAAYHLAHPTVTIKPNYNGSQILEQQIANGAPADVFASADAANMTKASDAGLVDASQVFVKNRLVVIVPSSNPGNISTLKDLAKKGVKIDLGANTVPAGKYALQVLDNLSKSPDYGATFGSSVLANVVSREDNVKAVVQKVQLGEADAGFVYRTDVTAAVASKVTVIDIPDPYNVIAEYPIAAVKASTHASDAQAFINFVLSPAGQAILTKYHFMAINS